MDFVSFKVAIISLKPAQKGQWCIYPWAHSGRRKHFEAAGAAIQKGHISND